MFDYSRYKKINPRAEQATLTVKALTPEISKPEKISQRIVSSSTNKDVAELSSEVSLLKAELKRKEKECETLQEWLAQAIEDGQVLMLELHSFRTLGKALVESAKQKQEQILRQDLQAQELKFIKSQLSYFKGKCAELESRNMALNHKYQMSLQVMQEEVHAEGEQEDYQLIEELFTENQALRKLLSISEEYQDYTNLAELIRKEESHLLAAAVEGSSCGDQEALISTIIKQASQDLKQLNQQRKHQSSSGDGEGELADQNSKNIKPKKQFLLGAPKPDSGDSSEEPSSEGQFASIFPI